MHRVGGAGCSAGSTRPRKEKRLTYVINHADNTKHCAGINCLAYLNASSPGTSDYLFTGSRDGTLRRWELKESDAIFSATFESHADWVNDAVIVGQSLVSCSSDTNLKIWDCCSDGACTRTLSGHSDYVICLAAAEKNSNIVASGGLGGEVFIWDLDAALSPVTKSVDATEDKVPNGNFGPSMETFRNFNPNVMNKGQSHGFSPIAAKGHKESVYALAMNDAGNLLVSGGTENVIRVWDPRTGMKNMKLRGHTDNIRALVLDSTGRYCLSGSSDSMIRLWDLGQQRCIHSYAVHTDSVWALASTPSFTHVYSGGRDQAMYLTDLLTRESVLLCTKEHPILQLSLQDGKIWAATTDSSVYGWPAEGQSLQKVFQRGSSFLAGNLSFSRARASLEALAPVPVYKEPSLTIPGVPAIVQHEILNNRTHVLTKDTAGSVKSWDITRGVVIEDFGKVSFEDKKHELFEMATIPAWFTMDARLGCLSVHLDTPQCFSAESYEVDLNIAGAQEEKKVNLAQVTLCGLLFRLQPQLNSDGSTGKGSSFRNLPRPNSEIDDELKNHANKVHHTFEFSTTSPPSIITEGSFGGPWRKRITDLVGTDLEEDIPKWCVDCKFEGKFPREATKCRFFLRPAEGSPVSHITEGKLIAPWISRILNAANHVITHLPAGLLNGSSDRIQPRQKLEPSVDILCNDQVVSTDMTLFQVRAYIWKRPEDLVLYYRVVLLR